MAKKINYNNLKSSDKKTFTQKKHKVHDIDGNEYTVLIDSVFKETKIIQSIAELELRTRFAKDNKIDFFNQALNLQLTVLKNFTDIDFPILDENNIEESFRKEIEMMEILLNLGLYESIFNKIDEKEIEKILHILQKNKRIESKITNNILQLNNIDIEGNIEDEDFVFNYEEKEEFEDE